jgi:hypothetical protein
MEAVTDKVDSLISRFASHDGMERRAARRLLVGMGESVVGALAEALKREHRHVRWEAAKALVEIASPESAPAFVGALMDRDFGVRWLAAEGLIVLGRAGLGPLLQALAEDPDSVRLREGAHHVLRVLADMGLHSVVGPLLGPLAGFDHELGLAVQAHRVLEALDRGQS